MFVHQGYKTIIRVHRPERDDVILMGGRLQAIPVSSVACIIGRNMLT